MSKRFMGSNAIHVEMILFTDGTTITDCDILLHDRFIVVGHDDAAPDFYSIQKVAAFYGMEKDKKDEYLRTRGIIS